jgi:pimeloyl-ACP methyl ester carboxylesterase
MPYFERAGARLHYQESGEGSPLVFTHGASLDSQQWQSQVDCFHRDHRVIVWDVRGHGQSTLPPGPVDPEDFVRDLVGLLDHLGLEQAVLCGLSMGGHISLQTAIRRPSRVKALVLIGTPCSNSFNLFERLAMPLNRWCNRRLSMRTLAKLESDALSKLHPDHREYLFQSFSSILPGDWGRLWDAITHMESKQELHRVQCPTLLLVGDHDNLTGRQQGFMHRQIAGSQLLTIPDAHHATNLDNPLAVNQAIEQFLGGQGLA